MLFCFFFEYLFEFVFTPINVYVFVRVAFSSSSSQIDPVDLVVDGLFLCDIVASFLTAYKNEQGELITSPRLISQRYIK